MDRLEKEIHNEIHKHKRIRWSPLKEIIVEKRELCSERIFREKLNGMISLGLAFRHEIDRNNVVYSTLADFEKSEKSQISMFYLFLKACLQNLERIEERMNKLSDTDRSDLIVSLLKIILYLEWGYKETFGITKHPEIKTLLDYVEELKRRLTDLVKSQNNKKQDDILSIIRHMIQSETIKSCIELQDKLYPLKIKDFEEAFQKKKKEI